MAPEEASQPEETYNNEEGYEPQENLSAGHGGDRPSR